MSTFTKVGDWHDLGHGHRFLLVESSYAEKVVGGVLTHNVLGTDQPCEPGLVAWEQPGGPVRPLFRVVSRPRETLSLEPFIVCEICGDKGWIQNGNWVPKDDASEGTPAQDPIPSVPLEGESEMFTMQVRRDLGDKVPEEEATADRKLYDLSGGPDIRLDPEPVEIEEVGDWAKVEDSQLLADIDALTDEANALPLEEELDPVVEAHRAFFGEDPVAETLNNLRRKIRGYKGELLAVDEEVEHVNHPAHYGGDTTYEAIKVIEAWELGFCLGNTVKYIARAGRKSGISDGGLRDLKKARWYLDREIAKMEQGEEN